MGKITSGCNSLRCLPVRAGIFCGLAKTVRPFINSVSRMRSSSSTAMATTARGLNRPEERPTPTRHCWHSRSNARLNCLICQPPKASWVIQAMAAIVISAVTIKVSLRRVRYFPGGRRVAPYPGYGSVRGAGFVARISAAQSGTSGLKHHLPAGDVDRLPGAV